MQSIYIISVGIIVVMPRFARNGIPFNKNGISRIIKKYRTIVLPKYLQAKLISLYLSILGSFRDRESPYFNY